MLNTLLDPGAVALLQQGYRNNWQQYLASLSGAGPSHATWDVCVLTASNARQAEAYEAQLEARRRAGLLPTETRFQVIADPEGLRIGSGGATLRALREMARKMPSAKAAEHSVPGHPFEGRRILIIHSGGDSRRLPHCSAIGKLFARVPHELPDGRPSSLFDEFLVSLSGLPGQSPEGVLVASGDVLLLFDHLQLSFTRPGVTGVGAVTPATMGVHHGVYVTDGSGQRVRSFLHKPSLDQMRAQGALQDDGRVQIDTGLVWFDRQSVGKLLTLAQRLDEPVSRGVTINLYGDLLAPLAESADRARYLTDASDGAATLALREARGVVWDTMRGTSLSVEQLHPAVFVHFGTTREYLQVLREGADALRPCGWSRRAASWMAPASSAQAGDAMVMVNTCAEAGGNLAGCALDSCLETRLELQEGALLSHVTTDRDMLSLGKDLVLEQLPLLDGAGHVTRLYGVDDDPKRSLGDGATFLNQPFPQWLAAAGLEADDLWPGISAASEHTLWTASLYPPRPSREESLDAVLWMQEPERAPRERLARWRGLRRYSLEESYLQADVRRLVDEEGQVQDVVRARWFCTGLEREQPARDIAGILGTGPDASRRARLVADWLASSPDPWLPLRGYPALTVATRSRRWEDRAFSALARLVRAHTPIDIQRRGSERALQHPAIVRAPARIDFGGGWTDTPPFSLERGGTVLNAAIELWGENPIVARADLLDEREMVLESRDIEAVFRPRFAGDLLDYANPADPFALHKAALVFRGVVPADLAPETAIDEVLGPLGRGLHLTTSTSIPRGSGLGTSSILAGAILRCLAHLLGQEVSQTRLFDEVLCLEQMITTGGGWQDQVGGLVGGVKLITTQPGLPQVARIQPVLLTPSLQSAFDDRLLLVYTGQRRLAKDLLRAIMGRWMRRDPDMVDMLEAIGQLAREMRATLVAEDLDVFGELIAQHWEINKRLDAGCTNPFIDDLLEMCRPFMRGAKLAGAGGGGFAVVVAQDRQAAQALAEALKRRYPRGDVGLWPCRVAQSGVY